MNMLQALGVAVAGLGMALFSGTACAEGDVLSRASIRSAVTELAAMLEQSYVFPDVAERYAARLRERLNAGAYDGLDQPAALASTLEGDLREVQPDAHLRISLSDSSAAPGPRRRRPPSGDQAFTDDRWLSEGVAYFRINALPGDAASVQRMTELMDRYEDAHVLILDLRDCPGGTLPAMDVLLSRLYAAPTELVRMETRAAEDGREPFDAAPSMHRMDAPAGIRRRSHWAVPTNPVSPLSEARIYVLTDRTASACEHLSMALQSTGRARLVGATTRGANHYGGEVPFGGDRFQVFMPIGRTYDPRTGHDWETVGITPDESVPPAEALDVVLREIARLDQHTSLPDSYIHNRARL